MGGLLSPPSAPKINMPPPPPPPAPMDQPEVAGAELEGGSPKQDEGPKTSGSKRKTRVYNKKQAGSKKYQGGGLNVV